MSANSATGSAAQSVQKWVIDSDVEHQLHSDDLWRRLSDKSLAYGSIELYLRCRYPERSIRRREVHMMKGCRPPHPIAVKLGHFK